MCTATTTRRRYRARSSSSAARSRSGDSGIGELKELHRGAASRRRLGGRARARSRRRTSRRSFARRRWGYIDADAIKPMKVMLDGGNGRSGPMVGPILDGFPLDQQQPTGSRTASSPTTSRTRCSRRTAASSLRRSPRPAPTRIAWDGDADRCFFIDDTGRVVAGDFLTALLAESLLAKEPGRRDPLRRARLARGAATWSRRRRPRPYINRVGHAFFKTRMRQLGRAVRRRGLRPLLLPRLLLRRLRHAPGAAHPRAAVGRGQALSELLAPLPRQLLHLRRDQLGGPRPGRRR